MSGGETGYSVTSATGSPVLHGAACALRSTDMTSFGSPSISTVAPRRCPKSSVSRSSDTTKARRPFTANESKAVKRSMFVLILALFAAPVQAQESDATPGYRFALAGAVTAHGLDLATSMHAIGAGQANEINPVLAPFSGKPLAFAAVKMGLASVGLLATDALRRNGHPKWAMALALIQTAVFTYVAIRNERLVRR